MRYRLTNRWFLAAIATTCVAAGAFMTAAQSAEPGGNANAEAPRIKMLFLGDEGHHNPADRAAQLIPVMKERGIDVTYTEDVNALNPSTLRGYDGLIIYANITAITPAQEQALLDYVAAGGGFVPIHCASYCFLNSPKYVDLVGAQFKSHNTGEFSVTDVAPNHPILKGLKGFSSWDETYVHTKHNTKNRTVLQTRTEGDHEEPWTWVRTQGKGRVFYTAWGHDQRTWGNPGFMNLIERGIRWVTADRLIAAQRPKLAPFQYVKADGVPFYAPGGKRGGDNKWDTMQLPLPPAESIKHIVTPPGFKAELFAAEPQIRPALAMAWDARGRLWLCESVDYPNNKLLDGTGHDSIRICEDTDGDGVADKFTVFADKLSIPTSITFARGGVIVHQPPDTLFLKDTDGDDRADVRQVLFTGWSTSDTHAGPSNLHVGLDNWVWGMLGYAGFNGPVGGRSYNFRMGFYRFKPDGSQIEFVRSTNNNTWGLGFSEEGVVFGSTANGNPSVYMPIANRFYEQVRGWAPATLGGIAASAAFHPITDRVRQVDWHGQYTAGAGHALYTARLYPKEYWNRTAFVCGPTGKLVGTFQIEPRGGDFASSNDWNLAASDDEWFAPISAEVGPDGCVWLLDWYNYIVQHNPTPVGFKTGKGNAYVSALRDKEHCRIYRIVPEGKPLPAPVRLDNASPQQLVATLSNDNLFWRNHAQRLLVERQNKDVTPALVELVGNGRVDEIGLNVGAIHALWTLKGLGALDGSDVTALTAAIRALRHHSAGVRRNAVAVLPPTDDALRAILDAGLLDDADAQVRLAALLALADMPNVGAVSDRAGAAVLDMLRQARNADDRWMPDAATAAAARHDAGFLRAVLASTQAKGPAASQPDAAKPKPQPVNLIQNPSLETVQGDRPANWRPVTYSGQATFAVDASGGHSGKRCVTIRSTNGADASWTFDTPVKPNTRYRLSAWVKTKGLDKGTGLGVLLNLHQLQKVGKTNATSGDRDWTQLTSEFTTGAQKSLAVNLLYGGWGRSKGQAWYDDVELIELGAAEGAPAGALGALGSGRIGQVIGIVTRHYAERAPVDSVIATLASLKGADEGLASFMLDGLVAGWPQGQSPKVSDVDKAELAALLKAMPAEERDRLVVLTRKWGQSDIFAGDVGAVVNTLQGQLRDADASAAARVDAARRLVSLADEPATVTAVLGQITPQSSSELVTGLITSLAESRRDETGAAFLKHWEDFTPTARRAAVAVLMRRTAWTAAMLDGVEKRYIHRADLSASDWQLLKLHRDKRVAAHAKALDANREDADRQKVLATMLPAVDLKGDAAKGHAIFVKLCAQCHTFNGEGGKIGPELTGIAVRPRKDILAEVIDPNRSLESNFRLWTIETTEFQTLSGRLDGESRTSVELLDLNGQRHVIQRKDIDRMIASPLSIMPVGLIDQLKHEEVASLLAFLESVKAKGK